MREKMFIERLFERGLDHVYTNTPDLSRDTELGMTDRRVHMGSRDRKMVIRKHMMMEL